MQLYEMITGNACTPDQEMQQLRIGRSCGCSYERIADMRGIIPSLERLAVRHLTRSSDRTFIATDIINRLADAESMEELILETDRVGHILRGWKWIDICLCEDWKHDFDNPDQFRQHGFSDRIYLALSKRYGKNAESGYFFPCSDILPALTEPHEPCVIVLTSLHCKGQIFGYSATMYSNPEDIDMNEQYVSWCEAIANGLHLLQKRLYVNHIHQQMESFTTIDPVTGMLNRRGFTEKLPDMLHQLRKQKLVYGAVMISWLTESADSAYDIAGIMVNALKAIQIAELHAKIGESIFAVLMASEDRQSLDRKTDQFISQTEAEMRRLLPDTAHLPQLITDIAELEGKKPAELERSVQKLLENFEEKKSITESHYVTYKELL